MIFTHTKTELTPIRTPNGRLYGMLDARTYALHIKDGANVRIIQIPPTGISLQYIAGGNQPEEIKIPPIADMHLML